MSPGCFRRLKAASHAAAAPPAAPIARYAHHGKLLPCPELGAVTARCKEAELDTPARSVTVTDTVKGPEPLSTQLSIENDDLLSSEQSPGNLCQAKRSGADPPDTTARNVAFEPTAPLSALTRRVTVGAAFTTNIETGEVTLIPFESFTTA
jgi:hypothetical protein